MGNCHSRKAAKARRPRASNQIVPADTPRASNQLVLADPPMPTSYPVRPELANLPWEMKLAIFTSLTSIKDMYRLASSCWVMRKVFVEAKNLIAFSHLTHHLGHRGLVRLALARYESSLWQNRCTHGFEPTPRVEGAGGRARETCHLCRLQRIAALEDWSRSLPPACVPPGLGRDRNAMVATAMILKRHRALKCITHRVAFLDRHRLVPQDVTSLWRAGRGGWRGLYPGGLDAAFGLTQFMALMYAYDTLQKVLSIDAFGRHHDVGASKRDIDAATDAEEYPGAAAHVDQLLGVLGRLDPRIDWVQDRFTFEGIVTGAGWVSAMSPESFQGPGIEQRMFYYYFPRSPEQGRAFSSTVREQMRMFGTQALVHMLQLHLLPLHKSQWKW